MTDIPLPTNVTPDPHNANCGTVRGRALLEKSLRELGAGRSIVADKHGTIIAGNKTLDVAVSVGIPTRVVETDGHELIVVQRTDLDLSEPTGMARRLAYADNRVGQIDLEWDAAALLADATAGLDLDAVGFRADELAAIFVGVPQPPPTDGDGQPAATVTCPKCGAEFTP